ncbi:hypothetical protein HGRIS_002056 [Hohenbuehelia grisea]|uniref:Uncharacterized protein n=1 Tax=Hohenbuehelia grisea TaxID=104357 RepID=A0ABR3JJR4_9AGAR
MPKLHLKRTPEEEARKAEKRRKKEHKSKHKTKKRHADAEPSTSTRKWASDDDDESDDGEPYGPPPPPPEPSSSNINIDANHHNHHHHHDSRYKIDYDAIRAELEEQRFREKLASAFDDDDRLDNVEAHFNHFAHVPDRWQSSGSGSGSSSRKTRRGIQDEFVEDFLTMDPAYMDDDEYAEWMRLGMYRKTHAAEYAEQQRKKAAKEERRAQEKAAKTETARLEKIAEEERRRRKMEREHLHWDVARQTYDRQWKSLLSKPPEAEAELEAEPDLAFEDIPWPILAAYPKPSKRERGSKPKPSFTSEELTPDAISLFILPPSSSSSASSSHTADEKAVQELKKERKDKLREAMLRFHPDKFEGRVMARVRPQDREKVQTAVGQVARALNTLMGAG